MSITRGIKKIGKTAAGVASGAAYGTAIVAAAVVGNTIDTVKAVVTAPVTIVTASAVGGYYKEPSWRNISKRATEEYNKRNS